MTLSEKHLKMTYTVSHSAVDKAGKEISNGFSKEFKTEQEAEDCIAELPEKERKDYDIWEHITKTEI